MTGHGIDAVSLETDEFSKNVLNNISEFLKNPLIEDIKFCLIHGDYGRLEITTIYDYDPVNGTEIIQIDTPKNKQTLISDFKFFASQYFNHPRFLKIDGKPFVQFDSDRIWVGNIEETIRQLREEIMKDGYELYLCSNILGWYFPGAPYDLLKTRNIQIVKAMDAISAHGNMWLYGERDARENFPQFVKDLYNRWYSFGTHFNSEIDLIPNIIPGEEPHPFFKKNGPSYIPLKRSPELFRELIQLAFDYTGRKRRIWKISAFNEFNAGLQIEPSVEEGFVYLQILKEFLKSNAVLHNS